MSPTDSKPDRFVDNITVVINSYDVNYYNGRLAWYDYSAVTGESAKRIEGSSSKFLGVADRIRVAGEKAPDQKAVDLTSDSVTLGHDNSKIRSADIQKPVIIKHRTFRICAEVQNRPFLDLYHTGAYFLTVIVFGCQSVASRLFWADFRRASCGDSADSLIDRDGRCVCRAPGKSGGTV